MRKRIVVGTACALAISLGALHVAVAQSDPPQPISPGPVRASEDHVTVLTMAPDGSWGVATDVSTNRAIANAIGNCKVMFRADNGCGAYFTTIRAGWSLGIRCGRENIIAAANELADAEQAAINRELELRRLYVPNMPACMRVVTVGPDGAIIAPKVEYPGETVVATGATTITAELKTDQGPLGATPSAAAKTAGEIPIWKTITLGTYGDVNILREDLDSLHCGRVGSADGVGVHPTFVLGTSTPLQCALGESAAEIIGRPAFTLSKTKTEVDLVVLSVSELGFKEEGARVADIYARAQQLGLELCPAEVGPQLRLQYLDQPLGEFLQIAMKAIATYAGELVDLTVANGGASLLLVGGNAGADPVGYSSARFVFIRPTRIAQPTVR